jgi:hypothetical protein
MSLGGEGEKDWTVWIENLTSCTNAFIVSFL